MNRATSPTGWARNPDGSPGYTWNPISGCLNHDKGLCKGGGFPCYAYKLANGRLKPLYLANMNCPTSVDFRNGEYKPDADAYLDPFYPRFWEERLNSPYSVMKPNQKGFVYYQQKAKGIFLCDMGELFGDWIPQNWQANIFQTINDNPQHRFYLLTKQPQNLIKFSPFPDNCWVGVTATTRASLKAAFWHLAGIEAKVKYLSLEPLLEEPPTSSLFKCISSVDWLIIGACTGTWLEMQHLCLKTDIPIVNVMPFGKKWTLQPKIEWVREIVEAADKAGVKVFLKDNLNPLCLHEQPFVTYDYRSFTNLEGKLRQELPE